MTALLVVAALLLGLALGFVAGLRFFIWRLDDQEVALAVIKNAYRRAHPHWLQRSKDDRTPVCPVCGWSEAEALGKPSKPHEPDAEVAAS